MFRNMPGNSSGVIWGFCFPASILSLARRHFSHSGKAQEVTYIHIPGIGPFPVPSPRGEGVAAGFCIRIACMSFT